MAKGGNGNGGGGKPGTGDGGDGGDGGAIQWKGGRGPDTLHIVDDGTPSGPDEVAASDFLAGTFDGGRGSDTLDFSDLTSDGITLRLYGNKFQDSLISLDQGNLGFHHDYGLDTAGFVIASIVNFENVIGTDGDDNISANTGAVSVIDGGAGNDRLSLIGQAGSVVVGGEGEDHLGGYNSHIYVGGTWDRTYGAQVGDNATDLFEGAGVILDFELPELNGLEVTFAGDQLMISGYVTADTVGVIGDVLALQFYNDPWTDPDGNVHEIVATLPTISGDDWLFKLIGVSAETANEVIAPSIRLNLSAFESVLLTGSPNDDVFHPFDQVLLELDGGNDTIEYFGDMDPSDDTFYFEGLVPTEWTHEVIDTFDTWTADYNGQTITVVGLNQEEFNGLNMVAVAEGALAGTMSMAELDSSYSDLLLA